MPPLQPPPPPFRPKQNTTVYTHVAGRDQHEWLDDSDGPLYADERYYYDARYGARTRPVADDDPDERGR